METLVSARERIYFWSSIFAMLTSTLFGFGHSMVVKNIARVERLELPLALHWYNALAPWIVTLPLLSIALYAAAERYCPRRAATATALLTALGWLYALAWPLFGIFSWEIFWYHPVVYMWG